MTAGIEHYYQDIVQDDDLAPAGFISLGTFCLIVMIFECFYRRTNRKTDMTVRTPSSERNNGNSMLVYTSDQIDKGVAAGMSLLIFDNSVLNRISFPCPTGFCMQVLFHTLAAVVAPGLYVWLVKYTCLSWCGSGLV